MELRGALGNTHNGQYLRQRPNRFLPSQQQQQVGMSERSHGEGSAEGIRCLLVPALRLCPPRSFTESIHTPVQSLHSLQHTGALLPCGF